MLNIKILQGKIHYYRTVIIAQLAFYLQISPEAPYYFEQQVL